MTIKYSPFYPVSTAAGIKGTSVPATRNLSRGAWATATLYSVGDLFTYNGSTYAVTATHTSTGSVPDFTKSTIYAASGIMSWSPVMTGGVVRDGTNFTNPINNGVANYFGKMYSSEFAVGMSISCKPAQANAEVLLGLDTAASAITNYQDLAYFVQMDSSGNLQAWAGASGFGVIGTYTTSDVITIQQRASTIEILKNGIVIYTWTGITSTTPYQAVALFSVIATLNSVTVSRVGFTGNLGDYKDIKFLRSLATPANPTGNDPSGWTDDIPAGNDTLWMIIGTKNAAGNLISLWSVPRRLSARVFRGSYSAATTYYIFDEVAYNGGTYIALQDNFSAQTPSGTANATAYWDVVAAPGATGSPATPPSAFTATINLSSGSAVNLRAAADSAGYTGNSDATITYNVPNGVTITGLSGSGIGLDTGSWPTGYTIALTLVVQAGGIVRGGGGVGGGIGANGTAGGDAIYLRVAMTGGITINSTGIVNAGGGGGGGGKNGTTGGAEPELTGGGGGGGGFPNGAGGLGGGASTLYPGGNGTAGTTGGGGAGGAAGGTGASAGGAGGNTAVAGTASGTRLGGAAGFAVRKNGFTATVTNNGTMTGSAS